MLICENYYLENNQAYKPLMALLERQKHSILNFPLKHFKLGILIDEGSHK
jgi:hypothetical protein